MTRPFGPGAARAAAAAIALIAAAGCAPGGRARPGGPDVGAECPELPGRAGPRSTFVFALTDPVDPAHAPVPANRSEAVLFRLLYDTLVDLDCAGRAVPAMAESWETPDGGRTWTFRLRGDLWYAHADRDGRRPVDADGVRDAWRELRRRTRARGWPVPWTWSAVRLRAVSAPESRVLRIALEAPEPDLPAILAGAEFAVATRRFEPAGPADLIWPQGTHGVVSDPHPGRAERDVVWWPESKDRRGTAVRITFRVRPGGDPRDLVVSDVDAMLVRDRGALGYLEESRDFLVTPFPWDATYYLVTRDPALERAADLPTRQDLAGRVVAGDARAAAGAPAALPDRPPAPAAELRRIACDASDPDARAIAERLAAVAATGAAPPAGAKLTLHAVDAAEVGRFAGTDAAVVVRVPRRATDALRRRELAAATGGTGRAVPLVDVRASLVTRRGLTGVRAGHDAVPRLGDGGWTGGSRP
jgi:hypothetical protein